MSSATLRVREGSVRLAAQPDDDRDESGDIKAFRGPLPMPETDADLMPPQRELDFRALILLTWSMRVQLLAAFLLVTIVYWGYWLAARDTLEVPTYSRVVQFSFDGVEDGRYPNGAPFHIGDLVTPKLIAALYDLHTLRERGVPERGFASAFAIEPHAPEYGYIVNRGEQLAERGTPAELVVLQDQLTAELRRAGSGAALLSFRPLTPLPLEQGDVGKLLLDLPRLWAMEAMSRYGVYGPDVYVHSPDLFDPADLEGMEYIAALAAIRRKANVFLNSVHNLMAVPHANLVRDPESGTGLLGVQDAAHELMDGLRRLTADVVQLGLARDRTALTREYEQRVAGLVAATDVASERVVALQAALVELAGSGATGVEPVASTASAPVGTLVEALLEREAEAARFRLELVQDRAFLDSLKRQTGTQTPKLSPPMHVRIAEIAADFRIRAAVVQRIHALLSRDNFATEGGLYRMADGGLIVNRPPAWRPRDVYIYILLVFAVATAVLIVGAAFRGRGPGEAG